MKTRMRMRAREIIKGDEDVDFLTRRFLESSILAMQDGSMKGETGIKLILASRHLERIADLACNVAEATILFGGRRSGQALLEKVACFIRSGASYHIHARQIHARSGGRIAPIGRAVGFLGHVDQLGYGQIPDQIVQGVLLGLAQAGQPAPCSLLCGSLSNSRWISSWVRSGEAPWRTPQIACTR